MPQVGWRDPATGEEKPFTDWLADAEAYGDALGFPYEILYGMWKQEQGEHRPGGFTATQLLGCPRSAYLSGHVEYYAEPADNYPAFRGVIGHAMLEANQMRESVVERRLFRTHRGVSLSGQMDKVWLRGGTRLDLESWLDWCDQMYEFETGKREQEPDSPEMPKGSTFVIQDWKTKNDVPFGNYVYTHHQEQGNLYRWLLRVPQDSVDINFIYVSMKEVKVMRLYNGGKYGNGREKPKQIWNDDQLIEFMDRRLLLLDAQVRKGAPLAYENVPTEDLWNCNYCPAKDLCYRLAADEARTAWLAGKRVRRIPPREKAEEEKIATPRRKKA